MKNSKHVTVPNYTPLHHKPHTKRSRFEYPLFFLLSLITVTISLCVIAVFLQRSIGNPIQLNIISEQ